MNRVLLAQTLPFEQWERVRPILRPLFIAEKERRRFAIGPHFTLLFENVQTVWYQIEEMLRVERIVDLDAVEHEIATYNELLPAPGELAATLFIEYPDPVERDRALAALVGIERHLWLRAGDRRVPGRFEQRQIGDDQVSSVQFVRFDLRGPAPLAALAEGHALQIEIDHPAAPFRTPIGVGLARLLEADLSS